MFLLPKYSVMESEKSCQVVSKTVVTCNVDLLCNITQRHQECKYEVATFTLMFLCCNTNGKARQKYLRPELPDFCQMIPLQRFCQIYDFNRVHVDEISLNLTIIKNMIRHNFFCEFLRANNLRIWIKTQRKVKKSAKFLPKCNFYSFTILLLKEPLQTWQLSAV